MLHDFLSVDKSPLVNLSKKGFKKASFAVTIGSVSLLVSTGVIPFTVAGISNAQVAIANCGYSRTYSAWWSKYTYLNRCAAYELSNALALEAGAKANSMAFAQHPYLRGALGIWTANNASASWALRRCADRTGQAYLRTYKGTFGQLPEISCN